MTFEGHTAVYFGTGEDGTQYFLSKNNAGDYSVDTYEELVDMWGTSGEINAYDIKDEYKGQDITDEDVDD